MTQDIRLNEELGFLRVGAAVPELKVADVDFNTGAIIELMLKAEAEGVQVLVFPEMAVTGYTIGDLVQQQALLDKAEEGLGRLLAGSAKSKAVIIVGMPVTAGQKIYNCAVILRDRKILGVVPKTYLPTYKEFYEYRWFTQGTESSVDMVELAGQAVPFGTDILVKLKGTSATMGVEICEDLWVPLSPHVYQALAGANVLINLSASNEILGKSDWRRVMISSESGRCVAAYVYTSSGTSESSNDLIFGGHALVAENGVILKESNRLQACPQLVVSDIDIERLNHDRAVTTTLGCAPGDSRSFRVIEAGLADVPAAKINRTLDAHPFVPQDPTRRADRCREIFSMQVAALGKKLTGAKQTRLVIGISGGLDSTQALLVSVKTMDYLSLPREHVYAFTLPGFGTTKRTKRNAEKLCRALGVSFEEMNIVKSSRAHLRDLKHGGEEDRVFENVQARYRTEFLFNKANQLRGIVVGTGDLTEIALGWSTFSGDQLSHYDVNASVPKTLIRYLVRWVADEEMAGTPAQEVLYDILKTPISPELLTPAKGKIAQKSEEIVGPVELSDFFLYPFIRFGMRPGKILYLANEVRKQRLFDSEYTLDELHRWLTSFIKRFFANQFKRTCFPEGPKVGSVSLSPRGDWRMPSDAEAALWLEELEKMYLKLKEG